MTLPLAQRWMMGAVALGIPLSAWGAHYPENTWLQVGPVAAGLVFAPWLLRRWPVSNLSAGCICAFVLLHLLAARWSYSYVPYDDWLNAVFGHGPGELFGWQRNMFDRLAHFVFGVLAMPVVAELAVRYAGASTRLALVLALLAVLGVGALYEVFEWGLTMAIAPEQAGEYNGEQGDPYDAQKDMAIAALGALLALPLASRLSVHRRADPASGG